MRSTPEAEWSYAAASGGISNSSTAVTIKAAAGPGQKNYVTDIQLMWESLTNATEVAIRDGAGGAVLWRTKIPSGAAGRDNIRLNTPIAGSVATLLEALTLTASGAGAVYVNAQGFVAT